jgi:hypothetical protein
MADEPVVARQGPPGPDQLPKGAAKEINQNFADANAQQGDKVLPKEQPTVPAEPGPVQLANPETGPVTPPGEDDAMLFGPSNQPLSHILTGATPTGQLSPPANVWDWLPALQESAKVPGAPPETQLLLDAIMHHLNN